MIADMYIDGDYRQKATTRFVIIPDETTRDLYPNRCWRLYTENEYLDSGIDLPLPRDISIEPNQTVKIGLGVRARCYLLSWEQDVPSGCPSAFSLRPRSSFSPAGGRSLSLTNSVGTIDMKYADELKITIKNNSHEKCELRRGDALVQMVGPGLKPVEYYVLDEKDAERVFPGNERFRLGGFGSTGTGGSATAIL